MASSPDSVSMALFCDFENVALGVRDAKYDKFDIKRVLERLLLKGSIVVKKAYCDWDRYKSFKAAMHEANFELIEIPHVRQSGKNSADIRLVVDALDLCYTKSHVDTFVIISGDSDFSPLVSKLRENAKQVIGVGVKQSTSDLLIANCDEFIFYDDLVRDSQRAAAKREARDNPPASKRSAEEDKAKREELEARRGKAIDIAVETFEALLAERGESGKIWSSMLKEAIKRRKPDFNESYFGFRAFGNLLEEAQARGLLELGRDEKSGTYVTRPAAGLAVAEVEVATETRPRTVPAETAAPVTPPQAEARAPRAARESGRGGRRRGGKAEEGVLVAESEPALESAPPVLETEPAVEGVTERDAVVQAHAEPEVPALESGAAVDEAAGASRERPAKTSRGGRGRGATKPRAAPASAAAEVEHSNSAASADDGLQASAGDRSVSAERRAADRGRRGEGKVAAATAQPTDVAGAPAVASPAMTPATTDETPRRGRRGGGRTASKSASSAPAETAAVEAGEGGKDKASSTAGGKARGGAAAAPHPESAGTARTESVAEPATTERKPAARARRTRKPTAEGGA